MSTPEDFMNPAEVQQFLDKLQPGEPFGVHFRKQNGEERTIVGSLDPTTSVTAKRKLAVPVQTEEGWKSFMVDRVYKIERKG